MNFKQIENDLIGFGIWRCKFVTYKFNPDKLGIIEMYVPKTVGRTKISYFIYNCIPAGCIVQVKELNSPLKLKKYTYSHEIKD